MWRCRTYAACSHRETQPSESSILFPQVCLYYTLPAQYSLCRTECIRAQDHAKQRGARARVVKFAQSRLRRGKHRLGLVEFSDGSDLEMIRSFAPCAVTELAISRCQPPALFAAWVGFQPKDSFGFPLGANRRRHMFCSRPDCRFAKL